MNRLSKLVISSIATAMAFSLSTGAKAEFPEKPIRLIVPWGAGGTSDLSMRKLAELAGNKLGQRIVVENKAGATGVTGLSEVASAAPDGYTLGLATGATVFIAPNIRKISFDPLKDLTPIMNYSGSFHGILVPAESPWKTVDDLFAAAKASPGAITYATAGTYDGAHFSVLVASNLKDVKFVNVPFSGGATAVAALLGRHVSFGVMAGFSEQVAAGKMRLLALLDGERMPEFPDVRTLREAGIDWEYPSIMGVVAPKGLSDNIYKKLERTLIEASETDDFKNYMKTIQMPMRVLNSKEFVDVINRESERYKNAASKYEIRQQ